MAKIKGSKGGSSKPRTPIEQRDNLLSTAKAKILLALGEGEFAGEVNARNIFLDGTPLENEDGSSNFEGVKFEFRSGTQSQDYIQGMPSSENEITVGNEIKSGSPWTRTITNTQLSAIRLRLKFPSLFKQEDNGDLNGYVVKYKIELQTNGGRWEVEVDDVAPGKSTTGYERSHRINLPQDGKVWTIRVTKITPDANSAKIGDKMVVESFAEVIDAKLRYPHTALLYIEFDSSQFGGSIPQISCESYGRIVRVPSNYNPGTRIYSGAWDGSFKWAWTDNPAWIFHDINVEDRFGLGDRIKSYNIDKWTLYEISQYCDQLVPDGKGGDGLEPRYICNVYVQDRNDGFPVLRDFAAIFRGMTYWGGDQLVALADMPRDVDYAYTSANVIDGKFIYSNSGSKSRYTTALVSYSDPDNAYSDAMEPVFEHNLVSRHGFNQLEITAIGCTRQSEANRKGRWGILTNSKDRMVSFSVGLDGNIPQPGYIVSVADELISGRVMGGRISAVSGRVLTLDRKPNAKEGDRLVINLPSGKSQSRTIQAINDNKVTVTTEYKETPQAESVWVIDADELYAQQYRVIGIIENDDGSFSITGAQHDPDKYARIDTGAMIEQRPVSVIPPGVQGSPKGVVISSYSSVNQGISVETLLCQWGPTDNAISYESQWKRNDGNWVNVPRSSVTSFEIQGVYAGRYISRVRAINASEISSGWSTSEETQLNGKEGNPPKPLAFKASTAIYGIDLDWNFDVNTSDTLKTELQYSTENTASSMQLLADVPYPLKTYSMSGLKAGIRFYFRARLVDKTGNQSEWSSIVSGESSADVDAILDAAGKEFLSTEAGKQLQDAIDLNMDKVIELESDSFLYEDIIAQQDIQLKRLNRASIEHSEQFGEITFNILAEKGDRRAEIKRQDGVIADEKEARAQSTELLKAEIGKNSAEIFSMKEVYANDEKSRALQQQLIESKFKFNDSAILEIRETTSTLESSYAEQKLQLESVTKHIDETDKTVKESSARITEAQKTATDAKNAQTEYQKVSESKFDEHQSSIEQSQLAANSAHSAVAKLSTELSAESARQNENINQANASLKRQDTVIATQTEALTQTKVELTAQLNENKAYIGRIDTALATESEARTTAETQIKAEIGENKAAITRIEKTVIDNEQSFSQSITQLNSQYESANSSITELSKTVADNKKAQAEENKLIKSELGENAAAIEQRAITSVDHQGNAQSTFTIKAGVALDGQMYDAKMMIGAGVKNGKVVTQIGFSADTFGIFNPANGKLEPVFFAENGQVFINSAFINSATIEKIVVGLDMRSKNYDPSKRTGTRIDMENGVIEIYGSDGLGGMVQKNNEISMYDENGKLCLFIGLWKGGNFGS